MILSFKHRFQDAIQDGRKIHTIRRDKNGRWKKGKIIQFATGVRTKHYNQFHEGICKSTQTIKIRYDGDSSYNPITGHTHYPALIIDGKEHRIYNSDRVFHDVVKNDGFTSVYLFLKWFDKDFDGVIIHWTDHSY